MVTMTSAARAVSSVSGFGNSRDGSKPRSSRIGHHRRVELVARLGSGRPDLDPALGVVVEQDPGSQAPPGVVDAEEQHDGLISHDGPLGQPIGSGPDGDSPAERIRW